MGSVGRARDAIAGTDVIGREIWAMQQEEIDVRQVELPQIAENLTGGDSLAFSQIANVAAAVWDGLVALAG